MNDRGLTSLGKKVAGQSSLLYSESWMTFEFPD